MSKVSGYSLSRKWWNFAFDNSECKSYHCALYGWIVELNNRLGWKSEFGLPTNATMEGLSIGNKNTYLNTLRDIEKWGFIKVVKEAKNQYQSCIIKLCYSESDTAQDTALDTALIQHSNDTDTGTDTGTDTIDKPVNKQTKKPKNKETGSVPPTLDRVIDFFILKQKPKTMAEAFYDHYTANGWVQGKSKPIKDWQAAARGWITRQPTFNQTSIPDRQNPPASIAESPTQRRNKRLNDLHAIK